MTWFGLVMALMIMFMLGFMVGRSAMKHQFERRLNRVVDRNDMAQSMERALSDALFNHQLRLLYDDPDHEINGGDLVEAIGFWVQGRPWLAIAELQAMMPEFEQEKDRP
jgi:hypothetical protein